MAITRSTAAGDKSGKIGNTVYYTSKGRQLSRAANNISNWGESARRSYKQQAWRVKWANLVNIYKNSKSWMYWAFESKRAGQTDYNKFMSVNIRSNTFYLTKSEAASGGCVIGSFQVTEGSLFPISMELVENYFRTNIATGLDGDISEMTIADVSADLINNNSWLEENMQISFISFQQYTDTNSTPRVLCTPYEVTLSLSSTNLWGDFLPKFCCRAVDGFICTDTNVSPGAHCFVLSNTVNGKTYVSTQTLVSYQNEVTQELYSSENQMNKAIESYGVDEEYFLESGSESTDVTAQPISINSISLDSKNWGGNTTGFAVPLNESFILKINCSMTVESFSDLALFGYYDTSVNIQPTITMGTAVYSDNVITVNDVVVTGVTQSGFYLWKLQAKINGTTLSFGAESAAALGYIPDTSQGELG